MKLILVLAMLLSFSLSAKTGCNGWHDFDLYEEEDMQFLDNYLNHFQPRLDCTKPLKAKDALKAAKDIVAQYQTCTDCDEPDVDYMKKITKGTYQMCTSDVVVSGRSDTYTKITFVRPYLSNGYNITFIKKAYE